MDEKKLSIEEELVERIKKDSIKKIKSREKSPGIIFGLGMFGIIGWSVSIPTIMGVALGVFLDKKFTQSFSWTLTLLFAGIIMGSFNAWHWIKEKTGDD